MTRVTELVHRLRGMFLEVPGTRPDAPHDAIVYSGGVIQN